MGLLLDLYKEDEKRRKENASQTRERIEQAYPGIGSFSAANLATRPSPTPDRTAREFASIMLKPPGPTITQPAAAIMPQLSDRGESSGRYTGSNRLLQGAQGVLDVVNSLGQKTADTLLHTDRRQLGGNYVPLQSPTAEKATNIGGVILGSAIPYGGIYKGLGALEATSRTAQRLTPLARVGVKGGLAGGAYETAAGFGRGESPGEIAKRAAIGTAAGALGDVAIAKLPGLIRAVRETGQMPKVRSLDLTKQFPQLPAPKQGGLLPEFASDPAGIVRTRGLASRLALKEPAPDAALRSYSDQMGYKWPLTTQQRGEVQLYKVLDDITQPIKERGVVPYESKRSLINFVHEGLEGSISKAEIRKLSYEQLADMAEDIVKESPPLMRIAEQEAAKRGVDLDDLFNTATDPEYARWKEVVGLAEPPPQPPSSKVPTKPTAELEAARNILPNIQNRARAQKILQTFPELRREFPKLGKQLKSKSFAESTPTSFELRQNMPQKPPGGVRAPAVETGKVFSGDSTKLRDLSGFRLNFTDTYRNFRDVFGKQYGKIKKSLLDPFDDAKKANIEYQENLLGDLKTNIVDRLGIKKGSNESALVQMYGEGQISLDELKRRAPGKWQNIVEADQWFRQQYDSLLDQVNAVRAQVYPNNPDRIIPKRKDYYRHFTEMTEGFGALRNIFDSPHQIDPRLEGISEYTLPKTKWQSFAQKRLGGRFDNDAVGGFLNYVPAASYSIHIDPHIGRFEQLAKELAEETADSRNANNFINWLRQFSQDLAGKTNPMDRWVQNNIPFGRMSFQVINWLNNRIKANVILGNVGSALSQTANMPLGMAKFKQYSVPGAGRALRSIFKADEAMKQSGFLKERFGGYGSKLYRQFDTGLLSKPFNFAVWMLESADRLGTTFIWESAYSKALAEGIKNPVRYADGATRELVAGRGIGEVALNQKARTFQLVAPFQVEVANLWSVMRDMTNEKDFGGLVLLALGNHLFNKAMEQTRGDGVVFDPIQAMIDASEEGLTPVQRFGRIGGEVLSNIPLGQTLANSEKLFPTYGGTGILGADMPSRKELFGRQDPTRYGSGLLLSKGFQEPLTKIITPFAGGQIKKTIEGSQSLKAQAGYSKSGDQLMFPIAPAPANKARGLLFGKWSFPEAREYFEQDRRPLSEKQTKEYEAAARSGNEQRVYNSIMQTRIQNRYQKEIQEIAKDPNLTQSEKTAKIRQLMAEARKELQR